MDLIKVPTLIQMEFYITIINPVKAYCLQSGCVNCYLEQRCGFNWWEASNPCSVEEVADNPKWFPSVLEKKVLNQGASPKQAILTPDRLADSLLYATDLLHPGVLDVHGTSLKEVLAD